MVDVMSSLNEAQLSCQYVTHCSAGISYNNCS